MYSKIISASLAGINAFLVEIETHLDTALPSFVIVGLPDSAVRESRERVTAAIKNSGYIFPAKKITVNLAPADVRKEGSGFDLPIALGLMASTGIIQASSFEDIVAVGELSLDGELRPVQGALSIAVETKTKGYKKLLLPKENAGEAALVGGIDIIPISTLKEAVEYIMGDLPIAPHQIDLESLFQNDEYSKLYNLSDVKGQENVKRALEVAAAGGHNIMMIGPPGSGKTMLARRIPSILPPLNPDEAIETTKIHSVAGLLSSGISLVTTRPFRSPHHTISDAALVGGGMNKIKPGEISLSHHGVLFLDELPEFARNVLEVLRQPLEDKAISISRARVKVDYPANFMLVCSMNPCPCGNFGNPAKECSCTPQQVRNYSGKISGPLLDRLDIHIEVPAVDYNELSSKRKGEASESVRERVVKARNIQTKRFENIKGVYKNSDMGSKEIEEFCKLNSASEALLKVAMEKLGLSARAHSRVLKLSRTIADLNGSEEIAIIHVSEAIQYRSLDREYWLQ